MEETLCDGGLGEAFLEEITKAWSIKEQTDQLDRLHWNVKPRLEIGF